MSKEIVICGNHEKQVPLISTFAFRGAEYWCPCCGALYGMFDDGPIEVESTKELEEAKKQWKEKSDDFLGAKATFACSHMMWGNKHITPEQLPEEEKQRLKNIIAAWRYEIEPGSHN